MPMIQALSFLRMQLLLMTFDFLFPVAFALPLLKETTGVTLLAEQLGLTFSTDHTEELQVAPWRYDALRRDIMRCNEL